MEEKVLKTNFDLLLETAQRYLSHPNRDVRSLALYVEGSLLAEKKKTQKITNAKTK